MVFVIHDRIGSTGDDARCNAGSVAEMTGGKDVWRPQQVGKTVNNGFIFPSCPITHDDGFSPMFLFVMRHALSNSVEGLVPRDAFPLSVAFPPDPFDRVGQSIRMVSELCRGDSLTAERAMVDGAVGISSDFHRLSLFGINQHPATPVAHSAVAFHHPVIAVNRHLSFYI